MVPDPTKPSCCLRITAPQFVALAAAMAFAILALTLLADVPAPRHAPPEESVPVQPLLMPLRS